MMAQKSSHYWPYRSAHLPPGCMLPPLFILAWVLGALAASPPLTTGSHNLRVLQIATFHDTVSTDAWGMALLGDMETNSLGCSTCPIRFCQPWAQRALSPEHWRNLELMIHMYLNNFIRQVKQWAKHLNLTFPFVVQGSIGCELHPNGTSRGFYTAALEGEDFVSFDRDTQEWVAWREDELTRYVRDSLNRDKGTIDLLHFLLNTTCINDLGSFLQYGKEALERQEHPVAVVFAREPPLTLGLLTPSLHLVCWVTGFYPQPIHVSWLRDGEKVAPGPRMSSTGILPNADLTYQLRSALAVAPEDGHRYACQVDHSSLQAGGLIIPWANTGHSNVGWTVGISILVLLIATGTAVMVIRLGRCRSYQDIRTEDLQP